MLPVAKAATVSKPSWAEQVENEEQAAGSANSPVQLDSAAGSNDQLVNSADFDSDDIILETTQNASLSMSMEEPRTPLSNQLGISPAVVAEQSHVKSVNTEMLEINGRRVVVVSGTVQGESSLEYTPALTKSQKKKQKAKQKKAMAQANGSSEKTSPPS